MAAVVGRGINQCVCKRAFTYRRAQTLVQPPGQTGPPQTTQLGAPQLDGRIVATPSRETSPKSAVRTGQGAGRSRSGGQWLASPGATETLRVNPPCKPHARLTDYTTRAHPSSHHGKIQILSRCQKAPTPSYQSPVTRGHAVDTDQQVGHQQQYSGSPERPIEPGAPAKDEAELGLLGTTSNRCTHTRQRTCMRAEHQSGGRG